MGAGMRDEFLNRGQLIKFPLILFLTFICFFSISCNNDEKKSANVKEIQEPVEEVIGSSEKNEQNEVAGSEIIQKSENEPNDNQIAQTTNKPSINKASAAEGKEVFLSKGCNACHTIGKGKLVGPDLLGVTKIREEDWLFKWLKDPDGMLKSDPIAKEMLKEFFVPMPNQGLTDGEINSIISYLKQEDLKK